MEQEVGRSGSNVKHSARAIFNFWLGHNVAEGAWRIVLLLSAICWFFIGFACAFPMSGVKSLAARFFTPWGRGMIVEHEWLGGSPVLWSALASAAFSVASASFLCLFFGAGSDARLIGYAHLILSFYLSLCGPALLSEAGIASTRLLIILGMSSALTGVLLICSHGRGFLRRHKYPSASELESAAAVEAVLGSG